MPQPSNSWRAEGLRSHKKKVLFLLIWFFVARSSRAIDPLGGGIGARPLALGNAYAALSSDGSALFANPAGLAEIKQLTLTSMYTQPESETVFTSLGGGQPNFWGGSIGIGYRNRTVSRVQASAETVSITNQDVILLFAKKARENLSLGGRLRFISNGMSKDVPGFESLFANGSALDLGFKYHLRPWLGIGAAVKNLGGKITKRTGAEEEIPLNTTLGISFKFGDKFLNLDLGKSAEEPLAQLHLGLEWWLIEALALRLGLDQSPKTSAENYNNLTAGLGLKHLGVTFDYALYRQEAPPQTITHYFSLGYIGPKEKEIKPTAEVTAIIYPTPESVAVRKIKRAHFADVPPNYWAREEIELLATAGVISGYPDGAFRPKQKVTRDEFEKLLAAAKHLPPASISEPEKFITRAEAAKKLGLPEKLTRPNDSLTRAEFAAFLSQTPFGQAAIKRLPPLE